MSPARVLMWAVAVALVAWAAWLWPDLPTRIPVHFDGAGTPDRWDGRSLLSWLGLPLVGLAPAAGLDVLAVWTRRHPRSPTLNLPNKQAVLDLPTERRAPVLQRVSDLLFATGAACLVAFALLQQGMWTAAHGGSGAGWVRAGGLSALVLPLGALVAVDAEVKRQTP